MRSRTRQLIVAVFVGVVGVVVASVAPANAAAPAGGVLNVDQDRAEELIAVAAADQGTFGGVSLDEAQGTLTVRYANGRLAAARSTVGSVTALGARSSREGLRVNLVAVNHSLAELESARERVVGGRAWSQVAGAAVSEWYVDVTRNVVAVGVTKVTPQLVAAARAEFGDLVSLHEAARAERTSRTSDWAPWGAGIRLTSGGTACTAGFFVEVPGTPSSRQMVTAGHCFANGAAVTNNGQLVGRISNRGAGGKDVAYIIGNFVAWTYKGPSTSDYGDHIRGAKASVVGQTFCTNGAFGGEVCSGTVNATNMCVAMTDGTTTCSLDRMTSGSVMTLRGDSGGNVFTYDSVGLKVGGIIIARNSTGTTTYFHSAAAVTPTGWRVSVA